MHEAVELILTCGSWQEAQQIADALLEEQLVACVEFIEIQSKFNRHHATEAAKEIKLIMTTVAGMFDALEAEVKKHHSYETFVLQQIPVHQVSVRAAKWLAEEVQSEADRIEQ